MPASPAFFFTTNLKFQICLQKLDKMCTFLFLTTFNFKLKYCSKASLLCPSQKNKILLWESLLCVSLKFQSFSQLPPHSNLSLKQDMTILSIYNMSIHLYTGWFEVTMWDALIIKLPSQQCGQPYYHRQARKK